MYRIYLSSPNMSSTSKELRYIEEAFATNWIAPLGPNVTSFEQEVNRFVGSTNVVALASLMLEALPSPKLPSALQGKTRQREAYK